MSVDPSIAMGGVAPPQGVCNTQMGAPPQAGAPAPMGPPGMLPPGVQIGPDGQPVPMPQQKPDKPPSMLPVEVAKQLAAALNQTKLAAGRQMAEYLGPARGNVNTNWVHLLKIWRKRNPDVDPLVEKLINHHSDEDILMMMYPARRALIRYGRRTYQEQVDFAEKMAALDADPRYATLDDKTEEPDDYEPPQSKYPSRGEEEHTRPDNTPEEEMVPDQEAA